MKFKFSKELRLEIISSLINVPKKKINITIKLLIKAGEAKSGVPLAPILGQYQVPLLDFCKDFNKESIELYNIGIQLPVVIRKRHEKKYSFFMKKPTLGFLFINYCYSNKDDLYDEDIIIYGKVFVRALDLFQIIRFNYVFCKIPIFLSTNSVFSYLSSFSYRVCITALEHLEKN